jgi:flagellar hook-associated protein 2
MAEPLSSISGLSSGIDSKALVEQIMLLERRPAMRLESTIDANTKKAAAFAQFKTLLAAFQTAAEGFKKGTGLSALSTTVAGTDSSGRALLAATASATSGAIAGSYQVEVKSLAAGQKTIGAPQSSASTALGLSGTVSLTVGGVALEGTLTIDPADTLTMVRDKINALSGTPPKVQATILSAGTTDQRLVLTGAQLGSPGAFAFADVSGTAGATLGLDAAPFLPAADASFVVDGVPMTRASNTVADAIAGVTLTLTSAEVGRTATINVERFPSAASDAAKTFVEAYNKVVQYVQALSTSTAGSPLKGDPMLRTVRAAMTQLVLDGGDGLPDDMSRLGSVGIQLQKDGTLSLNATMFSAAYASRQGDLTTMLADRGAALFARMDVFVATGTGMIDVRASVLTDRNAALSNRVSDIDSRLEKRRATLLAQYAKFEATLGRLKAIGDSLTSQLNGLNSGKDD